MKAWAIFGVIDGEGAIRLLGSLVYWVFRRLLELVVGTKFARDRSWLDSGQSSRENQ